MQPRACVDACPGQPSRAWLGVSAFVGWVARKHNRLSERPLLGMAATFRHGETAGLLLSNFGLGPAKITNTKWTVADEKTGQPQEVGEFSQSNINQFDRTLPFPPRATALGHHPFLGKDYKEFLLSVHGYDPDEHHWFKELIEKRLKIEIQYESINRGKRVTVVYPPRPTIS